MLIIRIIGINRIRRQGKANHLDFNKILSAKEGDNTEKVQKPNENSVSKVDTSH